MEREERARLLLAERLRAQAVAVAEDVTERFLQLHPDWVDRYGERARRFGVEDARYHVTFLAAALESGAPAAFAEYAAWSARVLEARGISRMHLAENLTHIGEALSLQLTPDAEVLGEYLDAALQAIGRSDDALDSSSAGDAVSRCRGMYLQAVLAGQRAAALTVVTEALRGGLAADAIYMEVLQPTLYEVGRLWETNSITVAHEHAATAITQFVMAHLYDRLERTAARRGTVVITGIEGELHGIGALMVADLLETRGWVVHFLGTNLPHQAILETVRERQPDCVGITATMLTSLPAVRRLITDLRREFGRSKRIVVGGAAFRQAPGVWQELDADGQALHLRAALDLMCA